MLGGRGKDKVKADSQTNGGQWADGAGGGGRLAGKQSLGESWRQETRSVLLKAHFSACHTHLAIRVGGGCGVSEICLAVSMKVQFINPEKVRGKLNMPS